MGKYTVNILFLLVFLVTIYFHSLLKQIFYEHVLQLLWTEETKKHLEGNFLMILL